ncbi:TPA: ABC transporter ATPase [Burkholderia vietnamiensis]|nr:ABC transporter ATPase [Burkholderia vietnamiensis]
MTPTEIVPAGLNPVAEVLKHIPTSTAHQARLQLYQPTRRPHWMERVITTPWGTATVRGKIGQVHADIVEAICRHAEDHRTVAATGHLQMLVDPYRVRVSVGGGKAYSNDTLWRMLTELREASITLEVPTLGLKVLGGILDRVEESPATRINHLTKKPRQLWRVTFDPAFAAMLRDDLHLYYDPAPLAKIETGVAQAIARHILTHRDQPTGGWLIDSLIKAVGAGGDSTAMRHRRREIRNCAESLKTVGLIVEDDRIFRDAA